MDPTETATAEQMPHGRRKLGPYTIIAPLGAGGMGFVYRARDERLARDVAIKIIEPRLFADEAARSRFRREALALARLNHPNIASVYDVGEHDGQDYLVMECVPGRTLRDWLAAGSASTAEILSLATEIAEALEEAHSQGVIHRDLKPGNIMVTPRGHVKILDFGLAKLLDSGDGGEASHRAGETTGIVGTPLYMSPEQAEGKGVDSRTDLWSLGVILYESLARRPPFRGESGLAILRSIVDDTPEPLRQIRADIPVETERIVSRALQKDISRRYQSADEMRRDLSAVVGGLTAPAQQPVSRRKPGWRYAVAAALPLVILAGAGGWFYRQSEWRHWAKDEAPQKINQLLRDDRSLAAFSLLNEAERILPGDPSLQQIERENTQIVSIDSSPRGAAVDLQDYLEPEKPWVRLGATPLKARLPKGYFRWRLAAAGAGELVCARRAYPTMTFDLASQAHISPRMQHVEAGVWSNMIAFVGWIGPYQLPPYDIDRFEVTNREYQQFVDAGGYSKPDWWKDRFVLNGRELKWDEAMKFFRDQSGRAGPSTWEAGHYPEGEADYPVSGVSWYEASAYARFAGKQLPVLAQWFQAAPPEVAAFTIQESNFAQKRIAAAGAFKGLGRYGTYDMLGNVREWVENATGDNFRFILGGAWNSQTYLSADPEALPAFDRSATNGFRCVRNLAPVPMNAVAAIASFSRDFSRVKPAADEVFAAYREMYAYDNTPLDAKNEGVVADTTDWREEKVTFNAAYGGERVPAFLFLPKKVRPPFQAVVFFPSARVLYTRDSRVLGDTEFFDYIVKSGRAVIYPIYKGTYERQDHLELPGAHNGTDLVIRRFRDVGRTIDYLRTRADIDGSRLAYLGVSMGAAEGVIFTTLLQDRLRTALFLDGGYFLNKPSPGIDQADFAPRLKLPVLMVNGRYDFTFPLAKAQEPFFRMLGTLEADKKHIVLETPHNVTARRGDLVPAVLDWLDRYLGRVQ